MISASLIPIFAMIALGLAISRSPLSSETVWIELERFTYYLFFPALLVSRLSSANISGDALFDITRVLGLALLVITLLIVTLRRVIGGDSGTLGAVYQGSIRFNTYIGLAVIEAVYGDRGLVTAALCLAVYIPLVNVLCVIALTARGDSNFNRAVLISRSVVSNPLVLACAAGILLSLGSWDLPREVMATLEILSQPALPLGLLAVGAGIRFVSMGPQSWQLLVAAVCKLALFPALVLLSSLLFEIPRNLALILVLLTCLPAPPSAYILARQLGGNVSLTANIITLETLAAFLMIPLWLQLSAQWL